MQRLELAEQFVDFPTSALSPFDAGLLADALGGTFSAHGDRERADVFDAKLSQVAERSKDPLLLLFDQRRRLRNLVIDGHLEEAVEAVQDVLETADQLGASVFGVQFVTTQTRRAFSLLGRGSEALEMDRRLQESRSALGAEALFIREVQTLAFIGRPEANAMIQEAARTLEEYGDNIATFAVAALLEAAILMRDAKTASSLAAKLNDLSHMAPSQMVLARLLAGTSALVGDSADAKSLYEEALAVSAKAGNRPEMALTHLELAELLLEHYHDERDAAIEHLDFAIAEFREMKMQPSLERALRHRGLLKA